MIFALTATWRLRLIWGARKLNLYVPFLALFNLQGTVKQGHHDTPGKDQLSGLTAAQKGQEEIDHAISDAETQLKNTLLPGEWDQGTTF